MSDIPPILIEQVREGRIVLLLGAGASKGAIHPEGRSPPDGQQLADLLSDKFLGGAFSGRPLDQVAALSISEADLGAVQEFIAAMYRPFRPAAFHNLIPTFRWRAITTTNYDLIIERAFEGVPSRLQDLVTFIKNGERIDERLRSPEGVMFSKLHGCITRTADIDIPLILTPEQYITHKKNRSRLFERLFDLAHEYPLLVVGNSLADVDLRQLLLELAELQDQMPRSYLIAPHITDAESRYWSNRKFTVIKRTWESLLSSLDSSIPTAARVLGSFRNPSDHPILRFLQLPPGTGLPNTIETYLRSNVEFIHSTLVTDTCIPKQFYKGYFQGWPEILANLDVKRAVTNVVLSEVVLPAEEDRVHRQELVVLKSHAGSGKTVSLRRIAWDAATELDVLCLFVLNQGGLDFDILRELGRLSKRRLFLFIDSATEYRESILNLMTKARRDNLQITIVTTERYNEWTAYCNDLDPYLTHFYKLAYLSDSEISELIGLLERHKSLGHLENLSPPERQKELAERAGRSLLVALHEATLGAPFTDIIVDEYNSIPNAQAKLLYLTICVLHRLNVAPRAGLISRVHGISLTLFKGELFLPLEDVVFAKKAADAIDYSYRTRHPRIADIVFERILTDPKDRLDEYIRIISSLDVDFESDRDALRGLANAKELEKLFPDVEMAREVFTTSRERDPVNAALFQQEALLEMHSGFLDRADTLLRSAISLRPNNPMFQHTLAELSLRRASKAATPIERTKYRNEARALALTLLRRSDNNSYAHHTILKVAFEELEETINAPVESVFATAVRDFEKLMAEAIQRHPGDSFILELDARFAELVDKQPRALLSLKKAFDINRRSTFIATRLARTLGRSGDIKGSIAILRQALDANPTEKELHFMLAETLDEHESGNRADIIYHLRSSFVQGDTRYRAQFSFARAEFLYGDRVRAESVFRSLGESRVEYRIKHERQGRVIGTRYYGSIIKIEPTYAFVSRDGDGAKVFTTPEDAALQGSASPRRGARVNFELAFNYFGAVAVDVRFGD